MKLVTGIEAIVAAETLGFAPTYRLRSFGLRRDSAATSVKAARKRFEGASYVSALVSIGSLGAISRGDTQ